MACAICHIRKPRRSCPGVNGDICTLCCGNEREVTVNCPFECEFLQEARKHERTGITDADNIPNKDIVVKEEFLEDHEIVLAGVSNALLRATLETEGAVDTDVRAALDALIRTYRTLQSGVYYEHRPDNALASRIFDGTQRGIEEFRRKETEQRGMAHTRDSEVLQMLVFLQRMELDRNNGRARGRAFIDFLRVFFSETVEGLAGRSSSLIVP